MLMFAHDLAQAAADPIARHRATDCARSDKASAESGGFICFENSEHEKPSAFGLALLFHALEITGTD